MTKWTITVVLCDLVLAIVINTSAMLVGGAPMSFVAWYPGVASAFFTNVLLQLILPVPAAGQLLSRPVAKSAWRWVVAVFFENLIFVTCISLTMAYLQAPTAVIATWKLTYIQLVLIGYVTSIILFLITNKGLPAKPEQD